MKTLRDYQTRLNTATETFLISEDGQRGQIYAPTGAGKTECFIALIKGAIARGVRNIAVLHPRLALSTDQLTRFKGDIGTDIMYSSFHSGAHVRGTETVREVVTTNVQELISVIETASTVIAKPHLTFTTYDSYKKLVNAEVKFDLIICDEAHYLVQDQFSEYLADMNADKILFYTATPIRDDMEDSGMLNLDLFGPVIGQVTPSELIQQGYIVAPLVHMLDCTTNKKAEKVDIVDVISISYVHQFKEVKTWGMTSHQMLVACRDVATDISENINQRVRELRDAITSISNNEIDGDTIDIYTVTSDAVYVNGSPFAGTRAQALATLKASGTNAIVAHYDTLSEGIDISTLNGVVIMREMSKAKLIQTIGRTARCDKSDLDDNFEPRKELFNLEKNIDTRKKRRGLVTFPIVDSKWVAGVTAKAVAEAFIAGGYGDLMDFMPKTEFKPTGKEKIGEDIDEPSWMSDIISNKLERALEELDKLFIFDDE
jgi:superfamily II DNA or RNA helicase